MLQTSLKIRSGALEGYELLVLRLGGNPVQLLQECNLVPESLRNPDTLISYSAFANLLELTALKCQAPTFGLLLGEKQGLNTVGALGLISAQQPTLGEALQLSRAYAHLHAHGANLSLHKHGATPYLTFDLELTRIQKTDQLIQATIALIHRMIQNMMGPDWRPKRIELRQASPPQGLTDLNPQLNCPLVFSGKFDGMVLHPNDLQRKTHRNEEQLSNYFTLQLHDLEVRHPNQLQAQIRLGISDLLPTGECNLKNIAAMLGLPARVLQKRLQQESSSFRLLLEETRCSIACEYLRNSQVPLTDLALQLGFAELAVFSRRFKSWTGLSPSKWRQQHQ